MTDDIKLDKSERLPGVEITPNNIRDRSLAKASYPRSEELARKVKQLSNLGLSKANIATVFGMSVAKLDQDYAEELIAGKHDLNVKLASLAMQAAESGDSKMIQYLCKVKLGWTETSTIEHVGEVRAVVSAKPLSKEEFEKQYISQTTSESVEED